MCDDSSAVGSRHVLSAANETPVARGSTAEVARAATEFVAAASGGPRVCLIESLDRLLDFRSPWETLLAETADPAWFQTLDWLTLAWRRPAPRGLPRVALVFDADRLAGAVPLSLSRRPTPLGDVATLEYPLDHWGTRFGPLGRDPGRTLAAALRWLSDEPRDWDLIDLRWVPARQADAVAAAFDAAGLAARREAYGERSSVVVAGRWADYWAARSSKTRNNVRRAEKRLAAWGRVDSIHCRPAGDDPRWDLYRMCEQVAAASWQGTAASGNTLSDKAVRGFLRDVHAAAARRGAASIHLLTLDGRPVAFHYDYVLRGRVFGLRTGYDPRVAAAGPGVALLARALRDSFERGDRELDLGETPAAYKRQWRTSVEPTFRFCHYRPHWRAQAVRLKRAVW